MVSKSIWVKKFINDEDLLILPILNLQTQDGRQFFKIDGPNEGSNESSARTEFSYGQYNFNLYIGHQMSGVECMKAGRQRRF